MLKHWRLYRKDRFQKGFFIEDFEMVQFLVLILLFEFRELIFSVLAIQ